MTIMSESGNSDIQGWEPPPLQKPTYDDVCDVCGQKFKGAHGVTMHKARMEDEAHGGRKWSRKAKESSDKHKERNQRYYQRKKARLAVEREEKQGDVMLRQAFVDDRGRILLIDERDGSWWVAQRLEM